MRGHDSQTHSASVQDCSPCNSFVDVLLLCELPAFFEQVQNADFFARVHRLDNVSALAPPLHEKT